MSALLSCAATRSQAADGCSQPVGRVVSVQGDVQLVRGAQSARTALNATLCAGDQIRVPPLGRAAVTLANETMIRLDQGSTLTFGAPTSDDASPLGFCSGAIYVITRTPRRFKVRTPFMNASVEGTEFLVEVDRASAPDTCPADQSSALQIALASEAARIGVVEGRVRVDNRFGQVELAGGQGATDTTLPGMALAVLPRDAARWTLHVPTVIDVSAIGLPPEWQTLADPQRSQLAADVLRSLERNANTATGQGRVQRAGLLLMLGRLHEAEALVSAALEHPADKPDALLAEAHALAAIIAVATNARDEALRQAQAAVQADPGSESAWLALSYAQQAAFRLDDALDSALRANASVSRERADARRALSLARVAELRMARGEVRAALASARDALAAQPASARALALFGFASLLNAETDNAGEAFTRATALDQGDPLPRLGLGLARIRRGDIAGGRQELEIAAALDTGNALVRSYLGKAYLEEGRDAQAATQFDLARSADPNDPTPWLYDAIRLSLAGRPVDALVQIERSLALNDRRAVYRSRLLLDQDRATRLVSLATVYADLALERDAIASAAASVADDPANHSAHRFLSEAYSRRERHDTARSSEELQAQLLQPPALRPALPELPFVDLGDVRAAPVASFSSEVGSLFERDGVRLAAGTMVGNLGSSGNRAMLSALRGPWSASFGYLDVATDGFRPNSDLLHRLWNAALAFAATPELTLQGDYRWRRSRYGDIVMEFDPAFFAPRDRNAIDQTITRFGLVYRPTPRSAFIVSSMRSRYDLDARFYEDGFFDGLLATRDLARVHEVQGQFQAGWGNVVAGAGRARVDTRTRLLFDFTPLLQVPCDATVEPCDVTDTARIRQWNGYVYANLKERGGLSGTVGLSRDHFAVARGISRWNPKLGLRAALGAGSTLRVATFGTLKRALVSQRTIEPTQIVGFNQFYDDPESTSSRFTVIALDLSPAPRTSVGFEGGHQAATVNAGAVGPAFQQIDPQHFTTDWLRLDGSLHTERALVVSAGVAVERYRLNSTIPLFDGPTSLLTTRVPLALRRLWAGGLLAELAVTGVAQRVGRRGDVTLPTGADHFAVVDLSFGWRLPGGRATLTLDVKNLFASRFSYQDDDFRSAEPRLSPYLPVRRIAAKVSFAL